MSFCDDVEYIEILRFLYKNAIYKDIASAKEMIFQMTVLPETTNCWNLHDD